MTFSLFTNTEGNSWASVFLCIRRTVTSGPSQRPGHWNVGQHKLLLLGRGQGPFSTQGYSLLMTNYSRVEVSDGPCRLCGDRPHRRRCNRGGSDLRRFADSLKNKPLENLYLSLITILQQPSLFQFQSSELS